MADHDDGDVFSLYEVRQKLQRLTDEEHAAINLSARLQSWLIPGAHSDVYKDVIHEAFVRVLDDDGLRGRRKWPRKYSAKQFFTGRNGVIRSIVSGLRERQKRRKTESNDHQAEELLSDEEFRLDIIALFLDDLDAQAIVRGMMGEDIAPIDQKMHERKRKKIRKRIVDYFERKLGIRLTPNEAEDEEDQ